MMDRPLDPILTRLTDCGARAYWNKRRPSGADNPEFCFRSQRLVCRLRFVGGRCLSRRLLLRHCHSLDIITWRSGGVDH